MLVLGGSWIIIFGVLIVRIRTDGTLMTDTTFEKVTEKHANTSGDNDLVE